MHAHITGIQYTLCPYVWELKQNPYTPKASSASEVSDEGEDEPEAGDKFHQNPYTPNKKNTKNSPGRGQISPKPNLQPSNPRSREQEREREREREREIYRIESVVEESRGAIGIERTLLADRDEREERESTDEGLGGLSGSRDR